MSPLLWSSRRILRGAQHRHLSTPVARPGNSACPDAAVCAVYETKQATEIPLAYVSLTEHHAKLSASEIQAVLADIRKWFDGQVASYKKLRGGIHHLQALPKTASGKILRRSLPAKIKEQRDNKL